ncbi:MAG: NAD-dependent epimerase/dehydratase family protein [Gammaproteobacteria bacterium]
MSPAAKRIVVTGGLGFIGTNLISHLRERDDLEFVVFDNRSNPSGDLQPDGERVRLVEGDIRDPAALAAALAGADCVVHLAAHTRVVESIENPALNFAINVQGTFNLLEAMRGAGVRQLVNASTGGAILGEVPPPVHERIAPSPASAYGASKLAAEGYCSAYMESYGITTASLRFSNIYGLFSRNKGSVVAAFLKDIAQRRAVTVYGDGSQTRDYLFAGDLVSGIERAIDSGAGGVFQLGSGRPTTINELLDVLREVLPVEFDVAYEPFRAGEIRHTWCDIAKAREAFDFDPRTSVADGVRRTFTWFEAQGLFR